MVKSSTSSAAKDYEEASTNCQQKEFLNMVSSLKIEAGFKCLDVGCGTGFNTAWLAKKVGKDGHVLGIDPDEKRIEMASETYNDISNLDFVVGKSVDIPPCNGGYDFIVSNCVMHWVNHDETVETYRKAFNALKPGGMLAILESSGYSKDIEAFFAVCDKELREKIRSFFFFTSAEKNREIFTEIGFQIVTLEEFIAQGIFESLDAYHKWIDATLHVVDSKEMIQRNKVTLDVGINDDGFVTLDICSTKIVATKPF